MKQKGELRGEYLKFNNPEMFTGTLILGPVAKECADIWPKIASSCSSIH